MSRWNDGIQAALFNPHRLLPTYSEEEAVKDFRYNAYYGEDKVPKLDGRSYRLILSGLVENRRPWALRELYALPQTSQITRLVCVEGWSMIGKWSGVPLRSFLERIGADLTAKIRRLRVRRRILFEHRHGLRPASADAAHVPDLGRDSRVQVRLSAEAADRDQARIQESEVDHGNVRDQSVSGGLLGRPRLQLVLGRVNEAARGCFGGGVYGYLLRRCGSKAALRYRHHGEGAEARTDQAPPAPVSHSRGGNRARLLFPYGHDQQSRRRGARAPSRRLYRVCAGRERGCVCTDRARRYRLRSCRWQRGGSSPRRGLRSLPAAGGRLAVWTRL